MDRVPDELWTEVRDILQETRIKTIPMDKKCKKAKWLSGEAFQIAVKRREAKSKGEKERYKRLNADFQRNPRANLVQNGLVGSPCSPRDSSLLQHHSSKASILRHSPFFTVQLSHPCMTTGKTIALTRQTFAGKAMSLLFNMLSRLVITFLLRSKCLNFIAAITICSDFRAPQNKVSHCFYCFPIYLP